VEKSVTDDKYVTYNYKNLVWAADLKTLYRIAASEKIPVEIKDKYEKVKSKILGNKGGESVFTLFLQIDEPLESFSKIANGHFFYTPSRKGLGETHRKELSNILSIFSSISKQELLDWLDKFTLLNTYEISIPGLKDKDMVPPGKTGVVISLLTWYELFKKLKKQDGLMSLLLNLKIVC
jgi:hypothetical protein